MKPLSDLFQILLTLPGAYAYLACFVLAWVLWALVRGCWHGGGMVWRAVKTVWQRVVGFSWLGFFSLLLSAVPMWFSRGWIVSELQYLEQVANPAYVSGDTSAFAVAVYESELSRHVSDREAEIVKTRTRQIAAKFGCSPVSIYEVAFSECGLDPFRIRDDGIAAGWIQFTRAGLGFVPGVTLPEVKQACYSRNTGKIMDWTETYFANAAKGQRLPDATAVYIAVFAPAYIGAPDTQVLYSRADGDAYTKNNIFDGYYTDGAGRVIRTTAAQDGEITIGELRLHLEAKKSRILNNVKR